MKLKLHRKYKNCTLGSRTYCIGKLYVDNIYICDTIEDEDFGLTQETPYTEISKIKSLHPRQVAIPYGKYDVTIKVLSPKYSKNEYMLKVCKGYVPRLEDVRGFMGILIHTGNTEQDSAGCIIVGYNTQKGKVLQSRKAFETLYKLLQIADLHGETITLDIVP